MQSITVDFAMCEKDRDIAANKKLNQKRTKKENMYFSDQGSYKQKHV